MSTPAPMILFYSQSEILQQMMDAWRALIPDAYLGDDGNTRLLFEVLAGVEESVFLAGQIVSEDMFVKTASPMALDHWGDQYGIILKPGSTSHGVLQFSAGAGTYIPIGAVGIHDPQNGQAVLYFQTLIDGTIPSPGVAEPPTLSAVGSGPLVIGTYNYAISFLTTEGETLIGAPGQEVVAVAGRQMSVSNISLGGPGTIARRIYRQRDGGGYRFVATITDNTTAVYTDLIPDSSLGGAPLSESTAQQISLDAESESFGTAYNVVPGAISELGDVPDGVTGVTNREAFTGGSDGESTDSYRRRLLQAVRSPGTGSETDLRTWAEAVEGVERATTFPNENMGSYQPGHVTVRISGPGESIPSDDTVNLVQLTLQQRDLANLIVHVTTFDPIVATIAVHLARQDGYSLDDVEDSVKLHIETYVRSLEVGETLRVNGIITAVYGQPGIADVSVGLPTTDLTAGATQKWTITDDDITVT